MAKHAPKRAKFHRSKNQTCKEFWTMPLLWNLLKCWILKLRGLNKPTLPQMKKKNLNYKRWHFLLKSLSTNMSLTQARKKAFSKILRQTKPLKINELRRNEAFLIQIHPSPSHQGGLCAKIIKPDSLDSFFKINSKVKNLIWELKINCSYVLF